MTVALAEVGAQQSVETVCGRTVAGAWMRVFAGQVRRGDAVLDQDGTWRYVDARRIQQPLGFAEVLPEDDEPWVGVTSDGEPCCSGLRNAELHVHTRGTTMTTSGDTRNEHRRGLGSGQLLQGL
jgi:hypothetical protein